jgi:hypothetical protein
MKRNAYRTCRGLLLTILTGTLGMAAEVHFGPIQIAAFENARLAATCDSASVPCEIVFEYESANGRVLKQASMTVQPGAAGYLDLSAAQSGISGPVLADPCWKVLRGSALPSLQVFDTLTLRTRILINWGDRSVPRSGDIDYGLAGITFFDTARMSASCSDESNVPGRGPLPCDVTFEFHDAGGRTLKQTRMTLQPGTIETAELRWQEAGGTGRRVEIDPCWKVAGGAAIGALAVIDNLSGLTLAHAYPAVLVTAQ